MILIFIETNSRLKIASNELCINFNSLPFCVNTRATSHCTLAQIYQATLFYGGL